MRLLLTALLLAAGSTDAADSGPAEVKSDRDTCHGCGMVISDRHFAAQVRLAGGIQTVKFDDIGCAVKFLDKQPAGQDPATAVWVMPLGDGPWLDARKAAFVTGKTSPMGFGFGALAGADGGLDFAAMKTRVLAAKPAHHH